MWATVRLAARVLGLDRVPGLDAGGCQFVDNKPWALSLIHGGDWLTKMLVMSAVLQLVEQDRDFREKSCFLQVRSRSLL